MSCIGTSTCSDTEGTCHLALQVSEHLPPEMFQLSRMVPEKDTMLKQELRPLFRFGGR